MIKIRYVAQVELDVEFPRLRQTLPIDKINDRVRDNMSGNLRKVIQKYIVPEVIGTVDITEQLIDVYETEGEDE